MSSANRRASTRSEVRFSESGIDPVTLDVKREIAPSSASNSRVSYEGASPRRSILKTERSVDCWLHGGSDDQGSDDVFEGFSQSLLSGLHEWMDWRTKLNSAMVDMIGKRPRVYSHLRSLRHKRSTDHMANTTEQDSPIAPQASEVALQRAVNDHVTNRQGLRLQAPTFMSFGLPRVKLRATPSHVSETGSSHDRGTGSASPQSTMDHSLSSADRDSQSEVDYVDRGPPRDRSVVIVSYTEGDCPRRDYDHHHQLETDSLCAILDLSDDSDDGF